ncbi:MAG: hypothetical protein IPM34_05450 [Saprospiraceae bacterium]|jgi:hypothetical protein|nr:hypothetical protein [Saprospiraceae bacterium]
MEYIKGTLPLVVSLNRWSSFSSESLDSEDPLLMKFIAVSKSRHLNLDEEIKKYFTQTQPTTNESKS